MIKKFLLSLLFKLVDSKDNFEGIDNERIEMWLENLTADPGFREYTRKRTLQILKTFGTMLDRESYYMLVGQRMELLRLMNEARKAQERAEAKKSKVEEDKK